MTVFWGALALCLGAWATYHVPFLMESANPEVLREWLITSAAFMLGAEALRTVATWLRPHLSRFGWFLRRKGGDLVLWLVKDRLKDRQPDELEQPEVPEVLEQPEVPEVPEQPRERQEPDVQPAPAKGGSRP